MCWVYKNIFFFFLKQKSFLNNFFFLNNFNFLTLVNFNVIKVNDPNYIFKFKNFDSFKTSNYLLKYITYFNKVVVLKNRSIKINQLNFLGSFNNYNYYFFNNYNYYFFKKLVNLVYSISVSQKNFVFFDKSYKNITPLYNYIFNFKNLSLYKNYFFINPKFFSYNNWLYYYLKFLNKFNIILILIFDFYFYSKFFKIFKKINRPIASFIPISNLNDSIDYPIYIFNLLNLEKFIALNIFTKVILTSYNYKNFINKIKYLNLFYIFCKKNIK